MQKNFDEFSIQEARRLAGTDAGKQLLAMLQANHSDTMQSALQSAGSGDLEQAKRSIAALLADPQMQALLKQLQEDSHG